VKKRILVVATAIVLILSLVLGGCGVSQEQYDEVVAERDAIQAELADSENKLADCESEATGLESELANCEAEVTDLESELASYEAELEEPQWITGEVDAGSTEEIYYNATDEPQDITVRATDGCPTKDSWFQIVASGCGNVQARYLIPDGETVTATFTVPPERGLVFQCNGVGGQCLYTLALAVIETIDNPCAVTKEVYRNRGNTSVDVTVWVSDKCQGEDSALKVWAKGENPPATPQKTCKIKDGKTRTVTVTVPAGGRLELECKGQTGRCQYALVEVSEVMAVVKVKCASNTRIYENHTDRTIRVTVQATDNCKGRYSTLDSEGPPGSGARGYFHYLVQEGRTKAVTFFVVPGGHIEFKCDGEEGTDCTYILLIGAGTLPKVTMKCAAITWTIYANRTEEIIDLTIIVENKCRVNKAYLSIYYKDRPTVTIEISPNAKLTINRSLSSWSSISLGCMGKVGVGCSYTISVE
jgi:hypothetical protein